MIAELKAATYGSEHLHGNQQRNPQVDVHFPATHTSPIATANDDPLIDTKGSIRYQRQRKK